MTDNQTQRNRRLDALIRDLAELVRRLERAIDDSGIAPGDLAPGMEPHAGRSPGVFSPYDAALLCVFALLGVRNTQKPDDIFLSASLSMASGRSHAKLHGLLDRLGQWQEQSREVAKIVGDCARLMTGSGATQVLFGAADGQSRDQRLVYIFERLLAVSDSTLRRTRGVYFTPGPVANYIVRSVDAVLQRELALEHGLATSGADLCVVDPACGSGAFLLAVVERMKQTLCHSGRSEDRSAWREFVGGVLPRRLVGIDLLPACCGAAELLVEQALADGEEIGSPGALGALSPQWSAEWSAQCLSPLDDVDHCRQLFADRLPVILGNPPYSNFGRQNRGAWILDQLNAYKAGLNEKKLNLDDDFIKFLRWAQYWIDQAGRGVLAMVTNSTYLSGVTHRQMRASLMESFDQIYVLDLHGSSKKRDRNPRGGADQNVFPIQQGVAIGLFVKSGRDKRQCGTRVAHAELWGGREQKLAQLAAASVETTEWTALDPEPPFHFFVPRNVTGAAGYLQWPRLDEIFERHISGVQTKRDVLFVGFTAEELECRMRRFFRDAARDHWAPDVPAWLRRKMAGVTFDRDAIRPYMVAPFDVRWVYYEPRLLGRARHSLLRHLDSRNVALVFMRQTTNPGSYDHFLATNMLVSDRLFYSAHGAPFVAPLYLQHDGHQVPNLDAEFVQRLENQLGAEFVDSRAGRLFALDARDVFHWIYAIAHSREYRRRFHALLSVDFPRIPMPGTLAQLRQLGQQGKHLAELHVRAARAFAERRGVPPAARLPHIRIAPGFPKWEPSGQLALDTGQLWPSRVETEVWRFQLGGYPVLSRWLKQRKNRVLDATDQDHLQRLIDTIRETLRRMAMIDKLVSVWPDLFE